MTLSELVCTATSFIPFYRFQHVVPAGGTQSRLFWHAFTIILRVRARLFNFAHLGAFVG